MNVLAPARRGWPRALAMFALLGLACAQHVPGSYEQGGRNYPVYSIQQACSNGTPDGESCMNNYECCSGICLPNTLMPGQGTCVQCETDGQCSDPMFPICDTSTFECVASVECGALGSTCSLDSDCCNGNCNKMLGICANPTPTKDSGTD